MAVALLSRASVSSRTLEGMAKMLPAKFEMAVSGKSPK